MASKNKTAEKPAASAGVAVDMDTLESIATGKLTYATQEQGQALAAAGLISVNGGDMQGNAARVTMTEAGIKALNDAGRQSSPVAANGQGSLSFEIDDYVPEPKRIRAPKGESTYPFDKLAVGQSFHIPVTAAKPAPHKSYSSLVGQAKLRYAEPVIDPATGKPVMETVTVKSRQVKDRKTGEMRTTPERTEERPKMTYPRDFKLRQVGKDDPRGPGARFVRVK